MSRAAGSVPGNILHVEREVGSGKWLGQLVKWLKAKKFKERGSGGQGKRHVDIRMGMGMKCEYICISCSALQRASSIEKIMQQPSRISQPADLSQPLSLASPVLNYGCIMSEL